MNIKNKNYKKRIINVVIQLWYDVECDEICRWNIVPSYVNNIIILEKVIQERVNVSSDDFELYRTYSRSVCLQLAGLSLHENRV